jgi:MauM/NapG family ferredoxin protein
MTEQPKAPGPKQSWRGLRWARRIVQGLSLALFLLLIGATASLTGSGFDASTSVEVPYPVEAYLMIDPLVGAITLLSTYSIPGWTILGLIVLASAALLGRGFCGWICPMGTMNHVVGAIRPGKRGKRLLEANRTRPYQKIKYVVLVGVLVAALCGSAVGGLLDPIAMATRGVTLTFLPLANWVLGGAITGGAESNVTALQGASDGLYEAIGGVIFYQRGIIVGGGMLVSLVFLVVLAVNRWIPRFWCRGLCPLGAMLGVSGRFGLLTLAKDQSRCDDCNKCQLSCSGAASPKPGDRWHRAECDLCMNCVAVCPQDALGFGLAGRKTDERALPDLRRRTVLAGAAAGAVLVPTMRTGALGSPRGRPDPACIRPPGAVEEEEFLSRCVRCGQCMKICPENALHPALDEAGVEGLWTPVLVPRIGYCQPSCTLCTQVCPTAAIRRVSEDEKTGRNGAEMVRIGTAFFDRGRCLPWAMGTPCQVCEEFCPTSPKAIWMKEVEVEVRGKLVRLKQPYMDPAQCNGCGACERVCPVNDQAAVRVTAAGESRSQQNSLLLASPAPSRTP